MGPGIERMLALINEVFQEEGWHGPLTVSLEGLTAKQAAWKPAGVKNSIWMIVNHLSLWKEFFASRMAGEPPRPKGWAKEMDWHEVAEVTGPAWQAALDRLRRAHAAVAAELAKRSDDDLNRSWANGSDQPLYNIQSMAAHDAYHCGQIRLLRVLQGAPAKPF